jgi:hypothetical protein
VALIASIINGHLPLVDGGGHMERFVRSLRVLWRSERVLTEHQFELKAQQLQLVALAALIAVFGLVMIGVASFFALAPYWGNALAALAVGGIDLVLAAGLVAYATSRRPSAEIEMVKEVRDMALSDVQAEVAEVDAELVAMKEDVRRLVRNPIDVLLPAGMAPLMGAVVRGLRTAKK